MTSFLEQVLVRFVRPAFRTWRDARYGYTRLVDVRVYRSYLLHNAEVFRQRYPSCALAPVLKSNAYGHGLLPVARTFDRPETAFLAVDGYYEALILRNEGIRAPILVLGYTPPENIRRTRLRNVAFTILDLPQLHDLAASLTAPRSFHLKIDTGMHRQGLLPGELDAALAALRRNPNLRLEGLCSHLADADGPDPAFTLRQIALWNNLVARFRETVPGLRYVHLAATAGTAYTDRIDANVMRVGLGLYGLTIPPRPEMGLKPALEVQARIGTVKPVRQGESVGYNVTYTAPRDLTMAVLPTGYNACVDRRLSNCGVVLIHDVPCPIIGRVSMNITTVDASAAGDVRPGDVATVISARPGDPNTVERIAALCDCSPYEVLVHIAPHLRRVIV